MSNKKSVKLGLVGCGIHLAEPGWNVHFEIPSIAWSRYFPQIANNSMADLIAVCDLDEARAKKAFKDNNAKEYYTNYEDMLDKADIEAVIITTPNKFHAPMAIKAMRAGKHVLVEKPFAVSFEEADAVVTASEKADAKLMALPVPSSRGMEAFNKVKEYVTNGTIGKVCLIRERYSHGGPGHAKWFYKLGGGPIFDLGVYAVTRITDLLGPAQNVQAYCGTALSERLVAGEKMKVEVEDNAVINLKFGNGVLASIETNYCTQYGMEIEISSMEIHGTEGSLFLEKRDQTLRVYTKKEVYPGLRGWFQKQFRGSWQSGPELSSFIDCIIQGTEPLYTGTHQRHVIEIIEGALNSAKKGRSQTLRSTF